MLFRSLPAFFNAVDIKKEKKEYICAYHAKDRRLKTPRPAPAVTRRKIQCEKFCGNAFMTHFMRNVRLAQMYDKQQYNLTEP